MERLRGVTWKLNPTAECLTPELAEQIKERRITQKRVENQRERDSLSSIVNRCGHSPLPLPLSLSNSIVGKNLVVITSPLPRKFQPQNRVARKQDGSGSSPRCVEKRSPLARSFSSATRVAMITSSRILIPKSHFPSHFVRSNSLPIKKDSFHFDQFLSTP